MTTSFWHGFADMHVVRDAELINREGKGADLGGRVRTLEPVVARELGRLTASPLVGEVRTVGLTAAVELSPEARAANPGAVDAVVAAARHHGVLTRNSRGVGLQFSPGFVITEDEIAQVAGCVRRGAAGRGEGLTRRCGTWRRAEAGPAGPMRRPPGGPRAR